MAPIKPVKKFASTIAELYAICRLCWNSCLENIADFTAYKTFYNALFVQTALTEIDAAEDMPSEQVRNEVAETLRIELTQTAESCLSKWRALRGYIKSSFATEVVEGKIEAAGEDFYDAAYHQSWEDLQQLMNEGSEFITANAATLTAGGMPPGFQAAFDADFAAYSPLYNAFKDAQMDAEEGTVNRMNANNALYEKVQAMNADGQIIYETNPGKFDRFVFARVKELVTPTSVPSTTVIIRGTVTDSATGLPIANAQMELNVPNQAEPEVTTTDAEGKYNYEFNHLEETDEGDVTLKALAIGYTTGERAFHAHAGNAYTQDFGLVHV